LPLFAELTKTLILGFVHAQTPAFSASAARREAAQLSQRGTRLKVLKAKSFHHLTGFFFGEVFSRSANRASNQAKSCFHCA
jgi:hypothetical protein